jgi:(1->4)-alpha-D-glucan 1-alpha-D-glucosylmutase
LASLNEVGGELDARPLGVDEFHRLMRHRMEQWPHSMSGTATHDTKRGEDFRARLHVLSEAAEEWGEAFLRWRKMNEPLRREADGEQAPDVNEEYLLYQTLIGTWPVEPMDSEQLDSYRNRIAQYMEKALREAKVHTSWMNPSENYDGAVREFITELLGDPGKPFRVELDAFVQQIADAGFVNSLAQVVLKSTLPGVPDFYQGAEFWDFSLVDPDNRRPVDFEARERSLQALLKTGEGDLERTADHVASRWPADDVKLWITTRCLNARNEWVDVFTFGEYVPLAVNGPTAEHVVAFARQVEEKCAITIVPRHVYGCVAASLQDANGKEKRNRIQMSEIIRPSESRRDSATWGNTRVALPEHGPRNWRCQLSGGRFEATTTADGLALDVAKLFESFPVALLFCEST